MPMLIDSRVMQAPVVVKLGGSAITDKSKTCSPRLGVIHQAVADIASYRKPLIVLHGGGSYAHPFITEAMLAKRFRRKSQLARVSEVELNLDQLTRIIGVALLLHDKAFVPIRPMSFLTLKSDSLGASFLQPITCALRDGMIPLIHGDLAFDEAGGCRVLSADRIASLLGDKLGVSRVLFGCDVEGVYACDPKESETATLIQEVDTSNYRQVLAGLKASSGDVTGGMRGKVQEALRLARRGCESYIFNLNGRSNLKELLGGSKSIGTRFAPWKHRSATTTSFA